MRFLSIGFLKINLEKIDFVELKEDMDGNVCVDVSFSGESRIRIYGRADIDKLLSTLERLEVGNEIRD